MTTLDTLVIGMIFAAPFALWAMVLIADYRRRQP